MPPTGSPRSQALTRAGLWERLQPKLVRADSVRQALIYAQTGDAEAAIVSRSLDGGPEVDSFDVDRSLYDPLIQSIGVVAGTHDRKSATEFVSFVLGDDGQSILGESGFLKPLPVTATNEKADSRTSSHSHD